MGCRIGKITFKDGTISHGSFHTKYSGIDISPSIESLQTHLERNKHLIKGIVLGVIYRDDRGVTVEQFGCTVAEVCYLKELLTGMIMENM